MGYSASMTLSVWNSYAGQDGAPTTPAGGSWVAGQYSYLLLAQLAAEVTSLDTAGWPTSVWAVWQNVAVTDSDKVTLAWTWPSGLPRPNHWRLLWQVGATYTLGSAGTLALLTGGGTGTVPGTLLTATWEAPGTAQVTVPAAYTSVTLAAVVEPGLQFSPRELKALGCSGLAYPQTVAHTPVLMSDTNYTVAAPGQILTIPLSRFSCSDADRAILIKWSLQATHVVLADAASGDSHLYKYIYGTLLPSGYLNSNMKGEPQNYELQMLVEGVTYA